jgi:hypothetical protein
MSDREAKRKVFNIMIGHGSGERDGGLVPGTMFNANDFVLEAMIAQLYDSVSDIESFQLPAEAGESAILTSFQIRLLNRMALTASRHRDVAVSTVDLMGDDEHGEELPLLMIPAKLRDIDEVMLRALVHDGMFFAAWDMVENLVRADMYDSEQAPQEGVCRGELHVKMNGKIVKSKGIGKRGQPTIADAVQRSADVREYNLYIKGDKPADSTRTDSF